MTKKKIILLGATGSVGSSVLEIINRYPNHFELHGFSAWNNIEKSIEIIKKFSPKYVTTKEQNSRLIEMFPKISFFHGEDGILELCRLKECDTIVSAILGLAGLKPALEGLKHCSNFVTANKEALVAGGKLLLNIAERYHSQIIPLDSEHLALFDLLRGIQKEEIQELVLTASGGPFFNKEISKDTSIEEVLKHPTWTMGQSITVGSALMINKGLEIIEAMRLFHMPEHKIRVLVHPQSLVHACVNTKGGHWHLLASPADMRYPALHALFYPNHPTETPFDTFDPTQKPLEFFEPDTKKFPLLKLSRDVAREDGILPTVLCASMEIAIQEFLQKNVRFIQIPEIIQECVESFENIYTPSIDDIFDTDTTARYRTNKIIQTKTLS